MFTNSSLSLDKVKKNEFSNINMGFSNSFFLFCFLHFFFFCLIRKPEKFDHINNCFLSTPSFFFHFPFFSYEFLGFMYFVCIFFDAIYLAVNFKRKRFLETTGKLTNIIKTFMKQFMRNENWSSEHKKISIMLSCTTHLIVDHYEASAQEPYISVWPFPCVWREK